MDETQPVIHEVKVSIGQAFNVAFGLVLGTLAGLAAGRVEVEARSNPLSVLHSLYSTGGR